MFNASIIYFVIPFTSPAFSLSIFSLLSFYSFFSSPQRAIETSILYFILFYFTRLVFTDTHSFINSKDGKKEFHHL